MLYYLFTYILGFYSGVVYNKQSINLKKEIDSILNTFLDKTNMNNTEYRTLNDYMDLINGKLDNLINKVYKKKDLSEIPSTINEEKEETEGKVEKEE